MNGTRMTSEHYNIIVGRLAKFSETCKLKTKVRSIVGAASRFNWELFLASKVEGNSIVFMTKKLKPYLTDDEIIAALMDITKVNGTGYCGSGVMRSEICYR